MATAAATREPNNAAREARRRRILERGSDRLALISGRIQSLPPDSDADQSRPSTCSPARISATDSSKHEVASSNPSLPSEETVKEHGQQTISDETVIPPRHNYQNGRDILEPSRSVAFATNEESSQIPLFTHRPAQDHQLEQTRRSLFTPSQIKSAIGASENTRTICSIAAAVLVIASCMRLPVIGFMLFRPVYLLLLTNTTIVLGCVFLRARGTESRMGRRSRAPTVSGKDMAEKLGRALELGLLVQKILSAVFMDFSIYAVVLFAGLALVQKLVW